VTGKRKTYVIMGMHRSGTSFLARCLQAAGVHIGDRLMGGAKGNPDGHFENMDFVELDRKIISAAGGTPLSGAMPPDAQSILSTKPDFDDAISALVKNSVKPSWGFKDPYSALTIPLIMPHILNEDDDPFIYVCFRKPKKVGESLQRRQDLNPVCGEHIAKEYNERILRFLRDFLELE